MGDEGLNTSASQTLFIHSALFGDSPPPLPLSGMHKVNNAHDFSFSPFLSAFSGAELGLSIGLKEVFLRYFYYNTVYTLLKNLVFCRSHALKIRPLGK